MAQRNSRGYQLRTFPCRVIHHAVSLRIFYGDKADRRAGDPIQPGPKPVYVHPSRYRAVAQRPLSYDRDTPDKLLGERQIRRGRKLRQQEIAALLNPSILPEEPVTLPDQNEFELLLELEAGA